MREAPRGRAKLFVGVDTVNVAVNLQHLVS